jgi:DNA-binding SARP family transcriptional activator
MIDLRLLGALEVHADRIDGTRGVLTQPKRLALFLYLALARPPGMHSRDVLMALLWPDADDESSRHSLRNALHALRHALGDGAIVTRGESWIGLDFGALRCDVLELRAHLAAARVDEAMALATGELAPGFHVSGAPEFERWLDDQRAELQRALRAAAWVHARTRCGSGAAEVDAIRQALRLDPGNEPGVRHVMQLLTDAGDRGGALEAYEELSDHLARELETQPSASTRALADALRSADVSDRPRRMRVSVGFTPAPIDSASAASPVRPVPSEPTNGGRRGRVLAGAVAAGVLALFALGHRPPRSGRASPLSSVLSASQDEAERAVLRLPARYRADSAAYRSYLRGLALRFDFRFMASRDTLAALVNREPLYVPGLYGLAHAYIFTALNDQTDPGEVWPKVDVLARRALALDSTAASAWLVLAAEDMHATGDLSRAHERIGRARMLDSLDPDVAGMLSVWFSFEGLMDSAVAAARVAHRLDPLSPLFSRLIGKHLYFARQYGESRAVFEQMLTDDPGWTRGYADLAELYRVTGHPRDAVTWLRRARAAAGDSAAAVALTDVARDGDALRLLAADARLTIRQLAGATREGRRARAAAYASAYALLGDTVATLRWLDSMSVHHDGYLHQVRLDPRFDFLRDDPRYQAWDALSGLPPRRSRPMSCASCTPLD